MKTDFWNFFFLLWCSLSHFSQFFLHVLSFFISYHCSVFFRFFQHCFVYLLLPHCTPFLSLFHASFSHPHVSIKTIFFLWFYSILFSLSCRSTVLEELFLRQVFLVKPRLYHLLDVWPWARYLFSFCFSIPICKIGINLILS